MGSGDIVNVYLSGRINDFVVSVAYPNLHIVFESGREINYPIYSAGMYEVFRNHQAGLELYQKVDKLYANFVSNIDKQSGELYESVSRTIALEKGNIQKYRRQQKLLQGE